MDSIIKDPFGNPLTDEEIEQMEDEYEYDKITGYCFHHEPDSFEWFRMNVPGYRELK